MLHSRLARWFHLFILRHEVEQVCRLAPYWDFDVAEYVHWCECGAFWISKRP